MKYAYVGARAYIHLIPKTVTKCINNSLWTSTVSDVLLSSSLLYQTPGPAFNTFTSGTNISNLEYRLFKQNILC